MVVCYLNIISIPLVPSKTYSPLIVDSYAMLSIAVSAKLLESIAGRHLQILKAVSSIQVE